MANKMCSLKSSMKEAIGKQLPQGFDGDNWTDYDWNTRKNLTQVLGQFKDGYLKV